MRKLTVLFFFVLAAIAAPRVLRAQIHDFTGSWKNRDANTKSVTTLKIHLNGGRLRVHAWGKCHPKDCDWGTVNGHAYGPQASSDLNASAKTVTAVFRTGFSETIVVLHSKSRNRLHANIYTRFRDNSGRTAYSASETFVREVRRPRRPPVVRRDCIPYDPNTLRIENEGAKGWLLTDGRSRLEMLDNREDAQRALALARRHTMQCFIGRDNHRSDRKSYIVEYWEGDSGLHPAIQGEDCIRYNPSKLHIVNEGANGWLLTDGRSRLLMLDTKSDAEAALRLAKRHTMQCFIGRGNHRPDRKDYIVQYWK